MLMLGRQSCVAGQAPYTALLFLTSGNGHLKATIQNTYLLPPLGPSNLASPAD